MATDVGKFRTRNASTGLQRMALRSTLTPPSLHVSNTELHAFDACDLVFFHHSSDSSWTTRLADGLRGVRPANRNLRFSFVDWGSAAGANVSLRADKNLLEGRLLAIVFSRTMLQENWCASRRAKDLLEETAASGRRLVTIVKDNVTIPPVLRLGEWFDFRNEQYFEESIAELASFLTQNATSSARENSLGVSPAKERILSNLFPVVELPKFIYSAETQFKSETELTDACAEAGPLPLLIKNFRVYTMECPSPDSAFARAASDWTASKQENFTSWFANPDRAEWGIELLNKTFRRHAWKRGLRWDAGTNQFFFPRNKPKSIWWEIGGQTVSREVTAPNLGWIELENQERAEVQYGWKHQSVRADFVNVQGNLFLRLEPGWLLTNLDSKTPATMQPVAPVFSGPHSRKRNAQILRSWRFWSTVLAKGHQEIRINTGQTPIRTKLTPLSGFTQSGIASDRMNYDEMVQTAMEDDLLMPILGPMQQEII